MATDFLTAAADRYGAANAAALSWMLDRPPLHGCFLNTKLNAITLKDYGPTDGMRGPAYLYGWIQGRGLEALVTHAAQLSDDHPELAVRLNAAARRLYDGLSRLVAWDGHAYFCYDASLSPVYRNAEGAVCPQLPAGSIYTFSDAFVAKGLVAAAAHFRLPEVGRHLDYLKRVIGAIESGHFQMTESGPIGDAALDRQEKDFGPRMILLGASGMLKRLGLSAHTGFADGFIGHVIDNHFDGRTGLLRTVPGRDESNIGHAIEFAGFALDHLPADADRGLVETLQRIAVSSYHAGRTGPGLVLTVSTATTKPTSPHFPWWSLPEAARAAALAFGRTRDPAAMDIWQDADQAFFGNFWRCKPPIAYQCRTMSGPVDFVPATPDLDPGYHTGLSLLTAQRVARQVVQFN